MRDFIKLSPKFWVGPTGRQIRKAGVAAQLVALYLVSSPHTNYLGLYHLPLVYVAADTGLSMDDVNGAISTLAKVGFARYDYDSETVWVVEGAKWQIGETITAGDKRVPMIQREYTEVPSDCPFRAEFLAKYASAYHMTGNDKPAKKEKAAKAPKKEEKVEAAPAELFEPAEAAVEATKVFNPFDAPIETDYEREKAEALLMANLEAFQAARDENGLGDPSEDKRIAASVLSNVKTWGYVVTNDALELVLAAADYALADMKPYLIRARTARDI